MARKSVSNNNYCASTWNLASLIPLYCVIFFCFPSYKYRKVATSNTSCLEAHAGFFRLLMKGIFGPYVL